MQKPEFPQETRRRVKKSVFSFLFNRLTISAFLVLIQFIFVVYILIAIRGRMIYAYRALQVISWLLIVWLIRKPDNPAYKIPWIIIIMAFAPFGACFYLFWGNTPFNRARLVKIQPIHTDLFDAFSPSDTRSLCTSYPRFRRNCEYLYHIAEMPAWKNTACEFFPLGEYLYQSMLLELKKAERFIFMEYFIIEPGIMWDSILEILCEKAAAGVEIRIMYDDVGCMSTLPMGYHKKLQAMGIHVVRFNRFLPMLNTYLNYRDHRKICVIDGNVGYTGGINLADEYINQKERFGHWKDTGVKLTGSGVINLTALFLQLWDFSTENRTSSLSDYSPTIQAPSDGYVQAFADSPLDNYNVSECVFMNMITNATKSVYITTPYLALDNEMITTLCTAAQSGIDVRIVTPGIPDKKTVYAITRSYYRQLMEAGVRIYEYTPGFLHEKMIVADHDIAVVGTINMDFRSFYLHFECGTVFYRSSVVDKVRDDILETISKSQEIDTQWLQSYPWIKSIGASLLSLFIPLM
ncbi:MAG: cardiolipin synthase [Eubacteriales bacterium]|nr:cardiolipin synthase [Eubacteriales bacterium]